MADQKPGQAMAGTETAAPGAGRNHLIFPLDVATADEALYWVKLLAGEVAFFKVGLELFVRCGPSIIEKILAIDKTRVFLDLKLHDIPHTVARAMAAVVDWGIELVTVHCDASAQMVEAAVEAADGRARVLGVTVLTSVGEAEIRQAGFRQDLAENMTELVLLRARLAQAAGCYGVVCSGREAAAVKSACGKAFRVITPGIRPDWGLSADDQQRIVTPAQAMRAGADYLVIGRPIRQSGSPVNAARRIAAEIKWTCKK